MRELSPPFISPPHDLISRGAEQQKQKGGQHPHISKGFSLEGHTSPAADSWQQRWHCRAWCGTGSGRSPARGQPDTADPTPREDRLLLVTPVGSSHLRLAQAAQLQGRVKPAPCEPPLCASVSFLQLREYGRWLPPGTPRATSKGKSFCQQVLLSHIS